MNNETHFLHYNCCHNREKRFNFITLARVRFAQQNIIIIICEECMHIVIIESNIMTLNANEYILYYFAAERNEYKYVCYILKFDTLIVLLLLLTSTSKCVNLMETNYYLSAAPFYFRPYQLKSIRIAMSTSACAM